MAQCWEANQEGESAFLLVPKWVASCFPPKEKKDSVIGGFGILEGKEFDDGDGYSYMLDNVFLLRIAEAYL